MSTPPILEAASLTPDAAPRSVTPPDRGKDRRGQGESRPTRLRGPTARWQAETSEHSSRRGEPRRATENAAATASIPAVISHRGPTRETRAPLSGETTRKTADSRISTAPA